uniref:Uncharacterized protein n=1 Tax=Fagus sylvatica TaxID=28930 RepID=A0A2N9FTD1_FAGSY
MGRKKKEKEGGKLSRFMNTPEAMAVFRHVYEIPKDVRLRYVHWSDALNPPTGDLLIPVVAIVEGGIRFPMDPLLADFLNYFRLSPSQVNSNVFRIVMGTVELNRRLGLELSIHDIVRTYVLHHNTRTEAYLLRPRDVNFTLVNGLPDTNRGFDENFLIMSGEWFLPGRKCPTRDGVPDPRRRNPRKSLININSLREVWESELCTEDYAQPRSAPLLLRYVAQTHSYLACRLVSDIQAARANPTNLALPAIDIRELLDVDAPDMSGINLRNLLPTPESRGHFRERAGLLSTGSKHKRRSLLPNWETWSVSGHLLRSGIQAQGEGSVPLWAPRMEYRGEGCSNGGRTAFLPVRNARSASVASALSQAVRLLLDMEEWKKSADDELINNLRRGLLMDTKRMATEAKRLADAANTKRVEAEESLNATLDSLTKAEDKVRTLELELERAKKEAYESGSKEAQDEIGRQLPRVCNEYYTDTWNDAIAVLNSGQTMLPPNSIKLPFPGATPPPHPEAILNSPPPLLGAVMVDLEEVESAEVVRLVDASLHDASDGGSAAPGEAGPNNL